MDYEKVYVAVLIRVAVDGKITPRGVEWADGRTYEVGRLLDVRVQPPSYVGGVLTELYDCEIEGSRKQLWRESDTGRWFVEKALTAR